MADADNERTLPAPITFAKPSDVTRVVIEAVVVQLNIGGRLVDLPFSVGGGSKLNADGTTSRTAGAEWSALVRAVKTELLAAGDLP